MTNESRESIPRHRIGGTVSADDRQQLLLDDLRVEVKQLAESLGRLNDRIVQIADGREAWKGNHTAPEGRSNQ